MANKLWKWKKEVYKINLFIYHAKLLMEVVMGKEKAHTKRIKKVKGKKSVFISKMINSYSNAENKCYLNTSLKEFVPSS